MEKKDIYNGTSNTDAGINTPIDQQDRTATDNISEAVEEAMDNIQETFQKDPKKSR